VSQKNPSEIDAVYQVVRKLRLIAVHSLARMYRPEERLFAFRLRRDGRGETLEGVSRRYTAMALIGLAGEEPNIAAEVLGGHSRDDVCGRLLDDVTESQELGEVALTTWAARILRHSSTHKILESLRRMDPARAAYPTIELSWALTALAVNPSEPTDVAIAERVANALMASFRWESGVFPHGPARKGIAALGAHVSNFADFVYPIQALSYYHKTSGDTKAAEVACRCAERMCRLQGQQGQWWWHYDARTGRVVERYPVYSVHQDAMAPMALFALAEACGRDHSESIEKGLRWLANSPEIAGSLIDTERNVIWRKVARREPYRLVRKMQAVASRLHPRLRVPAADVLFPPVAIDYETRPYHMGWILQAWSAGHTQ
jgi:hypothetical protein